jgi:hypothetical protein
MEPEESVSADEKLIQRIYLMLYIQDIIGEH